MAAGTNLYAYVGNNPVNRQAPCGKGCLFGYRVCFVWYVLNWNQFRNCASNIGLPSGTLICLSGCTFACLGGGSVACEICLMS